MADDRQRIIEEFDEAVNMTPIELEEWLRTDESKSVGQSDGGRVQGSRVGPQDRRDPQTEEVRLHRRRFRPYEEGQGLRQAPPRART